MIKDGGANVAFPAQPFSHCPGTTADPQLGPLQLNGGPTTGQTAAVVAATMATLDFQDAQVAVSYGTTTTYGSGTTFTFKLNESATYMLAFTRAVTGRKVKGHCVAQTRRNPAP